MSLMQTSNAIFLGIKDYFRKNNFKKAVIGLSGGIDSTVSAYLVARAIGGKNLTGILMPDNKITSKENIKDALTISKILRIRHEIVPINKTIKLFDEIAGSATAKRRVYALANTKARIRMVILYHIANLSGSLVIGTSDKSEIALGYTTKYGDNASDILVIGDLWKTEVIEIGKYLGVPENILKKKPCPELIPHLDAETELGATYDKIDKILKGYIENDLSMKELLMLGYDKKTVTSVIKRIILNEHKRRSPMIIRLSDRSFHGMEWRMPITNGYKEDTY